MNAFPAHPEKILIRSTNWIGDAVMTTPAVRTIRENFPESEITILVHPWVADVFRYSPRIDQVFLYEKKSRHKGLKGMLQLAGELRQQQYDCAILLQNAFEAALIAKVAGIPAIQSRIRGVSCAAVAASVRPIMSMSQSRSCRS